MYYKKEKLPEKYIRYNIFHSTDYDNLFENKIIKRGLSYYTNGKVKKLINKNNTYFANVIGTKTYKVKIQIENNKLNEISCTCPYHKDTNKYCKHIYAVLLAIKMQDERVNIIEYINKHVNCILTSIKEMDNALENNKDILNSYEIEWYKKRVISYQKIIKSLQKKYEKLKDFELFKILKELNFTLNTLYDDIKELNNKIHSSTKEEPIKQDNNTNTSTKINEKKNKQIIKKCFSILVKILLWGIVVIIALLSFILSLIKSIKSKKEEYKTLGEIFLGYYGLFRMNKTIKEKQTSDLMPWEQEEVNKGNYDPWNFEEEDLEDDDYYNDDLD